jgi:hypothetical protein
VSGPSYRIVRLSAERATEYDLDAFDCGERAYNEWLSLHAVSSVRAGVSAVYLLVEDVAESQRVVGYYAINPTQVLRADAPAALVRGWPQSIPAWKLGKLAIHLDLRADKKAAWGRQLLRDALETIVEIANIGGGKVIVVDALFMKVSTARKALTD